MLRRLLLVAAALGLVAVWGSAAFLKALDVPAFADQVTAHKITPAAWSGTLAFLLIVFEGLLAIAHLTFFRPRLAFAASAGLLLFFIGVTGWAWAHGNTEGCGCFGRLAARSPKDVILEDGLFVLLAAVGWWAAGAIKAPRRAPLFFAVLAPLALILPFVGAKIPADALVTTLNPGTDLHLLAADDLPGPLNDGPQLLVFLSDSCAACDAGLPNLADLAGRDDAPSVIGIFAGSRRDARAWGLVHVPPFPLASGPVKVLRQYYRRLPVTVLLKEGVVTQVWRNRVPTWADVQAALKRPKPAVKLSVGEEK